MIKNLDILIVINHKRCGEDRFNPILVGNFGLMIWNNYNKSKSNITIKMLDYYLDSKVVNSRWRLKAQ